MDDKRKRNVERDGIRKAVTIGIYSIKHKALYDLFYDTDGNLKDGKKPASDIPKMCVDQILGGGAADMAAVIQILLRIEDQISKLKGISVETDKAVDEIDQEIDDFLDMTGFVEG